MIKLEYPGPEELQGMLSLRITAGRGGERDREFIKAGSCALPVLLHEAGPPAKEARYGVLPQGWASMVFRTPGNVP